MLFDKYSYSLIAGAFLASIAGISAFVGFSATLSAAKKADPKYFNKGKFVNTYNTKVKCN